MKILVFFCYLFFIATCSFSQDLWKVKVDVDNSISIQSYWSDMTEELTVEVFSSFCEYSVDVILVGDNAKTLTFPDDFQLISGDSINRSIAEELTISIKNKKDILHQTTFVYEPSLNTLLQLDRYFSFDKLYDIWGTIIDAYNWEDKYGKNIIVRSFLEQETKVEGDTLFTKYLYLYHYIESENNELILLRKFTDSHKNCATGNMTNFSIESIELTDINRDTIGEISVCYDLRCNDQDTIPFTKKVLLTTYGEKYMVQAEVDPCVDTMPEISNSLNLKSLSYFDRFLRKKLIESL